mmetsp:Transcript_10997/g.16200  ORF Transcript_10997/g.16200 Transcript_10997/m.16200 type:complete len:328 (-) Transcript_10997:127-1110(-)
MARFFSLSLAAALVCQVAARTNIAVLEVGQGGVVRRSTSNSPKSTVEGVSSFWSSVHDVVNGKQRRRMQHSGMTLVPDLFNRADGGIVVGIMGNGVDLASMPTVAGIVEGASNDAIGHFHLSGQKGAELIERSSGEFVEDLDASLSAKVKELANKESNNSLESIAVRVENEASASVVDAAVARALKAVQKLASETGSTIVVHLVVEEEEGAARRRLTSRRLEDENENENDNDNNDNENDNNENNNADGEDDDGAQQNSAYYSAGYYDSSGNWVSGYRTIYQIQLFNTNLWTSLGLLLILTYAIGLMVNMPLMPDTLLFGESAKMMGE